MAMLKWKTAQCHRHDRTNIGARATTPWMRAFEGVRGSAQVHARPHVPSRPLRKTTVHRATEVLLRASISASEARRLVGTPMVRVTTDGAGVVFPINMTSARAE